MYNNLVRQQTVYAPMYQSGSTRYVGIRLSCSNTDRLNKGSNITPLSVAFENTSATSFTVQLQEGASISGSRTWVGASTALVPGGITQQSVYPTKQYLEAVCQSGSGTLKMQLESILRYDMLGFSKLGRDYDPDAPSENFQPAWQSNTAASSQNQNVGS